MGGCASLPRHGGGGREGGLLGATRRAEGRLGRLPVGGRYHRLPRRLKDDYALEEAVLGSGCSGQVALARSRRKDSGARKFAAKRFQLACASRDRREEMAAEVEIFLGMDHPHVARLVDAYESDKQLVLIMECLSGGDVLRRTEERRFSDAEAADAVHQMLLGINYLHWHGVVHRDVKLENFIYEAPGSDGLKLIDFGLSRIPDPNAKMALTCGTLAYMAPEVLQKSYTSLCDLWSLGVASFVLVFGYMPFSGPERRQVQNIKAAKFQVKRRAFAAASPTAESFVRALLVADPSARPTAAQALAHPWIAACGRAAAEPLDGGVVGALLGFGQASAFRRAALLMAAWSATGEERDRASREFLKMDLSCRGAIGRSDFKQVLQEQFQIADPRAEEMFRELDVYGDEEVRYSTFLAAMVDSQIGPRVDLLEAAFRRLDVRATGCVTPGDLQSALGESFAGVEVAVMLAEVRTSQAGRMSCDEFVAHFGGLAAAQVVAVEA